MKVKPDQEKNGANAEMAKIRQVVGQLISVDTDSNKLTLDVGDRMQDFEYDPATVGLTNDEFIDLIAGAHYVACAVSDGLIKRLQMTNKPE